MISIDFRYRFLSINHVWCTLRAPQVYHFLKLSSVTFDFLTILSKLRLTRKRWSCGSKLGYFFPLTNKDTELMHFDFLYEFHLHLKFIFHILKFVNVVIFLYLRMGLCVEYEALNPGKLILLSVLKMTNISLDDDRTPKGAGSLSPEYTPREGEVSFCPSNS